MKLLTLDVETAPNKAFVWGLFNQNVSLSQLVTPGYTLCWAAKWLGKPVQFGRKGQKGKAHFLRPLYDMMCEADVIITYYGSAFDIPTLNKEFLLLGWEPPTQFAQIDLCKVVKNRFKFASRKLDFVCQQLGIGAKTSHKGMDLWNGVMADNASDWRVMERYNRMDVVLTEKLYHRLLPWLPTTHGFKTICKKLNITEAA